MLLSLVLSLWLASPAFHHADVPARFDPSGGVPAQTIEQARKALDDRLMDYPAARFRNTYARMGSGGVIQFCGEANVKNGFGAMTGWKGFILTMTDRPEIVMGASCGEEPSERISQTDYAPALSSASATGSISSQ